MPQTFSNTISYIENLDNTCFGNRLNIISWSIPIFDTSFDRIVIVVGFIYNLFLELFGWNRGLFSRTFTTVSGICWVKWLVWFKFGQNRFSNLDDGDINLQIIIIIYIFILKIREHLSERLLCKIAQGLETCFHTSLRKNRRSSF